ncbi:MAG: DinB family protein, partial [Methyloligellaceae bacterium]
MPKSELYQAFATYNRCMNERVYEVCAGVPDAERKADRGAFFKSIHGTLNHLLYGDRAWLNRLADRAFELAPTGTDLYESFDELRAERAATDAEICDWAKSLSDAWLTTEVTWVSGIDDRERVQPHWLLVSHMFNHQTHHRGQLTTLLTQAGHDVGV